MQIKNHETNITHKKKIIIYGGGSFGTAIASAIAPISDCYLFTVEQAVCDEINNFHTNNRYLKDIILDKSLKSTINLRDLQNAEIIIIAVPSFAFIDAIENVKKYASSKAILLIATKGMVRENSVARPKLFSQYLSENCSNPFAFIAGPNLAGELARGLPAWMTIASENIVLAKELAEYFACKNLSFDTTIDVVTQQVASLSKNILAIYSGIVRAQNLGENARAAIISEGLKEIALLAKKLGSNGEALICNSVVGDLALTCYSEHSRNNKFGFELHQNNYDKVFIENYPSLVEGVAAARDLPQLVDIEQLEIPMIKSIIAKVS